MNRQQRRQQAKRERQQRAFQMKMTQETQPDFSAVPLATLCESIQMLVNELISRGYPMYDFDNKNRSLQQIQIIKNRVYFLADREENVDGKADD